MWRNRVGDPIMEIEPPTLSFEPWFVKALGTENYSSSSNCHDDSESEGSACCVKGSLGRGRSLIALRFHNRR
jgi:hypothetical protein